MPETPDFVTPGDLFRLALEMTADDCPEQVRFSGSKSPRLQLACPSGGLDVSRGLGSLFVGSAEKLSQERHINYMLEAFFDETYPFLPPRARRLLASGLHLIFKDFYYGAESGHHSVPKYLPCVVWAHSLCWSHRATMKFALDCDVTADKPALEPIDTPIDEPVELAFEKWRPVRVMFDQKLWVPVGKRRSDACFVRIPQTTQISVQGRNLSGAEHESLGLSEISRLSEGVLPAVQERIWNLRQGPEGLLAIPASEEVESSDKDLFKAGLIDAALLKLQRFFREPTGIPGQSSIFQETLVIALDRQDGHLLYIKKEFDKFEGNYLPRAFSQTVLGKWLAKYV